MALWRNVGNVVSIASGVTHAWQITYHNGRDVGVVVAAPNPQEINAELIELDQGVLVRPVGTELSTETHYTVKIRNLGTISLRYNLNIGDWQPDSGQAPQAQRISQFPPVVVDVGPLIAFAARQRTKPAAGRGGKKRAPRRR